MWTQFWIQPKKRWLHLYICLWLWNIQAMVVFTYKSKTFIAITYVLLIKTNLFRTYNFNLFNEKLITKIPLLMINVDFNVLLLRYLIRQPNTYNVQIQKASTTRIYFICSEDPAVFERMWGVASLITAGRRCYW